MADNVEDEPSLRDKVEVFKDRTHAGALIADKLSEYKDQGSSTIVVAIPFGGVPVGFSIATRLEVPLDFIIVRKIPIPWETEAGFGSITSDGSVFLNDELVRSLQLSKTTVTESIAMAKKKLDERTEKFIAARRKGLLRNINGKTVILVDDGLASGYTMLASVESISKRKPKRIIAAVPTGSLAAINLISPKVERLLCLNVRSGYSFAVADAYEEWYDVPEEEALRLATLSSAEM